jgi:APA family basic amino acid/polyamine antiporter
MLIAIFLVADLAYLAPDTSGIGYLLVLTGVPVYLIWHRKATRKAGDETAPSP